MSQKRAETSGMKRLRRRAIRLYENIKGLRIGLTDTRIRLGKSENTIYSLLAKVHELEHRVAALEPIPEAKLSDGN